MATITSNGTGGGLWSAPSTWNGGVVPVDDDTVVIASGDTVTFDVDTSGFASGIAGITVTGTLTVSTTTSSYLKMKASTYITGAGTLNIGTLAAPIPFTTKFTADLANYRIEGGSGLTCTVYAAEPVYKAIYLSGAEAIGQTELSVDTDVTGDIWAAGDTVIISDTNAKDAEERVIAAGGIAATTITVTAGLTAAKNVGAAVVLCTRNVKIFSTSYGFNNFKANNLTIGGGYLSAGSSVYTINSSLNTTITGGVIKAGSGGMSGCSNSNISGGVFIGVNSVSLLYNANYNISGGMFMGGCDYILHVCNGSVITGGTFGFASTAIYNTTAFYMTGATIKSVAYGIRDCKDIYISGVTFQSNIYDFDRENYGKLNNQTLTSAVEVNNYASMLPNTELQSVHHDGAEGALKAWTKGGVVTSQNTIVPTGYSLAYIHALESATYPCFWRKYFSVPAGTSLSIEVQLRKTASMAYLPRVYLMESIGNPLAGTTPIDSFTMTDSVDTWETDTFIIDNSAATYDKEYVLWFVGQNATGTVYSAYNFTPPSGGGGAVKIVPFGGLRL